MDELEALFLANGVDLHFSGHQHSYTRTCPVARYACTPGAPVYVCNGAAGALFTVGGIVPAYANLTLAFSDDQWGVSYFEANGTHLHGQWVLNADGSVADDFWLVK